MPPVNDAVYRRLLRPILFRLDPERAHRWTIAVLSRMPAIERADPAPALATTAFGVAFRNPIGLAAGVDKDARAIAAWDALGFGFAEVGTVTPRPQPGNPKPRIWRLPRQRALINRLGFPGEGMEAAAARLEKIRRRGLRIRIALNFGPNKDTPAERVAEDFAALTGRLASLADFIVVNLSSPNTPGLREWQAPERIRAIVEAVRGACASNFKPPPLLIKIAPDVDPEQLRQICEAAIALAIDGIVATNTTVMHEVVGVTGEFQGGLSGEPLRKRAREVIAGVFAHTHGRMQIIGVGGVASAEDAYDHIRAGASLIEFYTGMLYQGPGLARSMTRGLVRLLARDGFRSISEAVGSASRK